MVVVNYDLQDQCTSNTRQRLKQALNTLHFNDIANYAHMTNSLINSDLAQFKHDHINEFNQFIDEFELSPNSGGFDLLATVDRYAPID